MIDTKLFEFAKIHYAVVGERYIMAAETRTADVVLNYLKTNTLRIDNLVFNPRTNQIRFMLLPRRANKQTEVFNVVPTTHFLRQFYNLDVDGLRSALTQYMVQSDLKYQYDGLDEAEKTWLSSVILGAKEE